MIEAESDAVAVLRSLKPEAMRSLPLSGFGREIEVFSLMTFSCPMSFLTASDASAAESRISSNAVMIPSVSR